jgi:hypothetical protein
MAKSPVGMVDILDVGFNPRIDDLKPMLKCRRYERQETKPVPSIGNSGLDLFTSPTHPRNHCFQYEGT